MALLRDQVPIFCASLSDLPLSRQEISGLTDVSLAQQNMIGVGGKELHNCVGSGDDNMHNFVGVGVGGSNASGTGGSASASHSRITSHMHMHRILIEDKLSMMSMKGMCRDMCLIIRSRKSHSQFH